MGTRTETAAATAIAGFALKKLAGEFAQHGQRIARGAIGVHQGEIDQRIESLKAQALSDDAAVIDAAVKSLADSTEAFAAERMNRGIRSALAGRRVEEV